MLEEGGDAEEICAWHYIYIYIYVYIYMRQEPLRIIRRSSLCHDKT